MKLGTSVYWLGLACMHLCWGTYLDSTALEEKTCLSISGAGKQQSFLSHGGETMPLLLGVSDRVTHQLVTYVFYIFLKEVMNYNYLKIDHYGVVNTTEIFDSLSEPDHHPRIMINLEVGLPTDDEHIAEIFNVRDCGSIAPNVTGRYAWFIMKKHNEIYPKSDHWTFFLNKTNAQKFHQKISYIRNLEKNSKKEIKKLHFNLTEFIPDRCKGIPCATLLADRNENTSFLMDQIEKMNLYVVVVWVNDLKLVVNMLKNHFNISQTPGFVLMAYTPSEVVLPRDDNFVTTLFPPCDTLKRMSILTKCHYDSQRLLKLAWAELSVVAKPAFQSLHNMQLKFEDYREMLEDYNRRETEVEFWDVACSWLKRHQNDSLSWRGWKARSDEKNILYIGGIFPLANNLHSSTGIVAGGKMAMDAVNKNPEILPGYSLELLLDDGQCKADIVMKIFIEYVLMDRYKRLIGILGPACSDTIEPLAGVAKHFRTVVISYSAEGSSFSDRKKYPYFFRTIGENQQYKYVYLELMKQMKWRRVASLTEDGTKYTEYLSQTHDLFQNNNITYVANRKFPQDWNIETMKQSLHDLNNKKARIIIADVKEEVARAVMCEAYHLNMTMPNGYVWFLPHWFSKEWYNTDLHKTTRGRILNCTTNQMIQAIKWHFALSHSYFGPPDSIMQENITVSKWRQRYKEKCNSTNTTESNYAGFAYDAYWTYAYALDKLLKENQSYISNIHSTAANSKLVEIIQATDFNGVSGRIHFGSGSSRHSNINIVQWISPNESSVVGTYYPNITERGDNRGKLEIFDKIRWPTKDGPPKDGPDEDCVFLFIMKTFNTTCGRSVLIVNVMIIFFFFGVLFISFILIKRKYEKNMQQTQRIIKSLGIDLLKPLGSLDVWEIPRERVVINRKLGEGAFGTVYGGEAHYNEKGWVAVAVKTLKVGSTTEEKLDFLSEAEVMKRFDHKNIVQLLGVCTKNEPVYTIMEFMLYGDLKTFLLARRHLVNEKVSEESDEVSSKKLTSMALDVARALSYLAELKYVHRDVASRNCLVNASRVVKLGDFGMTRLMFQNDYYKFSRKGMLPVRWMAPESLALGIFTPASDVWSYGVLLYEIITFGSFPFQGLSNNQVLEHVKAGHTITIPGQVKPLLEGLIKSCWSQDHKKRPQASEIVEFIANNPRLLYPCLDVPLSSVQIEDTGQLEMQLPQLSRKFSMSLRKRRGSETESEVEVVGGGPRPWVDVSDEPLLPSPNLISLYPANNSTQYYPNHQDSVL